MYLMYDRPLGQFLPKSLKKLKLQQTDVPLFVSWLDAVRKIPCFNLRSLSLVVDVISDDLLITVMHSLPRLELDLEDRPFMEPSVRDMTNIGLPALKFCECLIVLSIVRSERNYPSFKRVKNIGMFHVSERCRRLESVKLGGFAKVTEAGYSSILHSCWNLKKFEVLTSPLLSDSVFDNMIGVARSVIELSHLERWKLLFSSICTIFTRNGLLLLVASALTYLILSITNDTLCS
ncbi:F-box protein At-B-like isoform X1 [Capsicum chacoense]